jgi:hypothetical protein
MGVECVRSLSRKAGIQEDVLPSPASQSSFKTSPFHQVSGDGTPGLLLSTEHDGLEATPLGHLPTGEELGKLIELYFESVHRTYTTSLHFVICRLTIKDFGFFAFIHQLHFNRLLAEGKAPRELTLMMIASASR